jgi:hypothetical protein
MAPSTLMFKKPNNLGPSNSLKSLREIREHPCSIFICLLKGLAIEFSAVENVARRDRN